MYQALEAAGDQRKEYWNNRIKPFWQKVWPKSRNRVSKNMVDPLVQLCIAAREEFEEAFKTVQDWIIPSDFPNYVIDRLFKSGLCDRFPKTSLDILSKIIDNQQWAPGELRNCLNSIIQAEPKLMKSLEYVHLNEYCLEHNI